ncbi:hypothetical protein K6025_04945 [Ehrlichia sp. JZT12]
MFVNLSARQIFFITLVLCPILPIVWLLYIVIQTLICDSREKHFIENKLQEIEKCIEDNQGFRVDCVKFTFNLFELESMLYEFQEKYAGVYVSEHGDKLTKSKALSLLDIVDEMVELLNDLKQEAVNAGILVKLKNRNEIPERNSFSGDECEMYCHNLLQRLNEKAKRLSNLSETGISVFQVRSDLFTLSGCIKILVEDCEFNFKCIKSNLQPNLNSDIVISEYHVGPQRA